MSDRARPAQVPVCASLDFPACGRRRAQSVRKLWLFSAYKMLYCAEMGHVAGAARPSTGNRLKWQLYNIDK
jgi:hypothetical protein